MKIDINKLDFKKVSDNIYQINHDKDVLKFWSPKICVPFGIDKDYDKYYIKLELEDNVNPTSDDVLRKLLQPSVSPVAPHLKQALMEATEIIPSSGSASETKNKNKNTESHIYFRKVISHIEKLIKKKLDIQDNEFKSVIRNRGSNKTELIECRIKNFKKNFQTTVEYEDNENNYLKTIFDIEKQSYVKVLCEIYGLWDYRTESKENNKIGLILYATKIIVLK
jgi:hypothetical protein